MAGERTEAAAWQELDDLQPMPTALFLGRHEPNTPPWHDLRAAGIGGSEVAAILGLSPWQSPFSLWHSKANGWIDESGPEQEWGTRLEPVLLDWWFDEHPYDRYGVPGGTYAQQGMAWRHANPDACAVSALGELVVVEAKKASSDDDWGTPGTDEIPPYYRVQVMWYMDVLGIQLASIVVTNLGRAPVAYWVEHDQDEANLLREHAFTFWRSLNLGEPPDLDGTSATYQAVRRLHPDIDDETVTVDPWTAVEWRIAKRRLARAETRARETSSRLLAQMGRARRACTPTGIPVARRQPARAGTVALYEIGSK